MLDYEPRELEVIPTRTYIRRHVELQMYGHTDACLGCSASPLGTIAMPHSLECRDLFENAISSEESDEIKRRIEESKRRREVAGARLGLVLMIYHQVKWLANRHCWGSQEQRDSNGGTSLWEHSFTNENCGRVTTNICRRKRQTSHEIQDRRVGIGE